MKLFLGILLIHYVFQSCVVSPSPLHNSPNPDNYFVVGNCPASVYFQKEQKCAQIFFESIRKDRKEIKNCSAKYVELRNCMVDVFKKCLHESLVASFLGNQQHIVQENFLKLIGDEDHWCKFGGLGIPQYLYKGIRCDPIFAYTAKDCVNKYQNVFNSPASYRRLCREYNQAQTCLYRNLITHCSFESRSLRQMIAFLIEIKYDYQPYCLKPQAKTPTFEELGKKNACPSYAHADVTFLLDVSNRTTTLEFLMMKRMIWSVAMRLNYGMSGIYISVIQYGESMQVSIPMSGYPTKGKFLRVLKQIRRVPQGKKTLTGKMMLKLAENQLNLGEPTSVIRPFHTPILVVLTTGKSEDELVNTAVDKLTERGVNILRFGYTYNDTRHDSDVTFNVKNILEFLSHGKTVVNEICTADRAYRTSEQSTFVYEEHFRQERSSVLSQLRNHVFSRFPQLHLPLLWEPEALEFIPFTLKNITIPGEYDVDLLEPSFYDSFEFPPLSSNSFLPIDSGFIEEGASPRGGSRFR